MAKSEQGFIQMTTSKEFKENTRKRKGKAIKDLKSKSELSTVEQEKLISLEQEVQDLTQELAELEK